jgi:signal peptidase II
MIGASVPPRFRLLLTVATAILVLDQATKFFIDRTFRLYESVPVVENFFHLTYVRNKGAAFGIFADSAVRVPFLISVSLVASLGILWYLGKLRDSQVLTNFALSLIFGGAVGNLIDRVRFGEVIDFLDAHWYQYHWPAFNVADSAISVGVALLLIDMLREERRKRDEGSARQPTNE